MCGKTTLVVHAELKLEWGREKYINYLDGEEWGGHCRAPFGGWMVHHLRNESGIRLCPLCKSGIPGNISSPIVPKRNG